MAYYNNLHRFLAHLAKATEAERDEWDAGMRDGGNDVTLRDTPIYKAGWGIGYAASRFTVPPVTAPLMPPIPEDECAQEGQVA